MQANYIRYNEFDASKLIIDVPERKQIPRKQPASYYHEAHIQYNFGTEEQPKLGPLLMEWPEIYANGGISAIADQNGRKNYSIYVQLPEEEETGELVKVDDLLYTVIGMHIARNKGTFNLTSYSPIIPSGPNGALQFSKAQSVGLFTPIISYPVDKLTGNIIAGKPPRAYLKLMKRGFGAAEEKTLFTDLNATPINWDLLSGVQMKFIPVLYYEKIYIGGGKASIQAKVQSAVVTYLVGKNTQTCQTLTIERLKQERPDAVNTLAEQIARLTMDRQDTLLNKPIQTGVLHEISQPETSAPSTSGLNDFLNANPVNMGLPQIPQLSAPSTARSDYSVGSIKFH